MLAWAAAHPAGLRRAPPEDQYHTLHTNPVGSGEHKKMTGFTVLKTNLLNLRTSESRYSHPKPLINAHLLNHLALVQ